MREDDIRAAYARNSNTYQLAVNRANAEFAEAEAAGDTDAMDVAAWKIAGLRATMREMGGLAQEGINQHHAPIFGTDGQELKPQDAALCRKYQLAPQELEIAKNWTTAENMTKEAKIESYLNKRAELQHKRATGQYRDDQGRVTRS
jgi:hypothetical protein